LVRADAAAATPHPFGWRHELRARLIEGRCALADGDRVAAAAAADDVRIEAERLGLPRYVTFSRILGAQAFQRGIDAVEPDIRALDRLAPLEAWWLTAALADAFEVPAWRELAAERVDRLTREAGDYGAVLRDAAVLAALT
jgi:hypothetical protein